MFPLLEVTNCDTKLAIQSHHDLIIKCLSDLEQPNFEKTDLRHFFSKDQCLNWKFSYIQTLTVWVRVVLIMLCSYF